MVPSIVSGWLLLTMKWPPLAITGFSSILFSIGGDKRQQSERSLTASDMLIPINICLPPNTNDGFWSAASGSTRRTSNINAATVDFRRVMTPPVLGGIYHERHTPVRDSMTC